MTSFQTWSSKLNVLLQRARAIASNDDLEGRLKLMDELTQFVIDSTPNTPDILALDALAKAAINDIALTTIEERVARISTRTSELATISKRFGALAADAKATASAINLEQINKTVISLTGTVAALNELKGSLTSGQHAKVAARITDVINQVQALRTDVDALA